MKLKLSVILFMSLLLLFGPSGCKSEKSNTTDTKTITVSILPFGYFVKMIAGSNYKINTIVPTGASPATFEPPPSVIRSLKDSKALIINRYLGFELAWLDKLLEVNPEINTLFLADNQELIAAEAHKHGDHMHYSGVDPHFWISPASARIIARDIRSFLIVLYPEDQTIFESNYLSLIAEIDRVEEYAKNALIGLENKRFLIFHPALTYLARDFGLTQVPIELDGKEPTAAWLKKVIDIAHKDKIQVILVQEEFNKSSAETIAKEINGRVVDIFPLSENWPKAVVEIVDALSLQNTE